MRMPRHGRFIGVPVPWKALQQRRPSPPSRPSILGVGFIGPSHGYKPRFALTAVKPDPWTEARLCARDSVSALDAMDDSSNLQVTWESFGQQGGFSARVGLRRAIPWLGFCLRACLLLPKP